MTDEQQPEQPHQSQRGVARHLARVAAVQTLYQIEIGKVGAEKAIEIFTDDYMPLNADREFFHYLVREVIAKLPEIDAIIIAELPKDWPMTRLDAVLRALMRVATAELLTRGDIPPLVTISEFVDIAHSFFSGKEPGLVHNMLDRIGHAIRGADFATVKTASDGLDQIQ
ncbi:MAG: transcription antitermination factor NusB [Candidatus Pacebacteria bacterium]|nr:transcription antitermination factor NusB [Candidatus Paceibacterota bacterium]